MTEYEERILACISCNKKIKQVVLKKRKIKDFLCQKCAKDEIR